jgi:hypothetical protein
MHTAAYFSLKEKTGFFWFWLWQTGMKKCADWFRLL